MNQTPHKPFLSYENQLKKLDEEYGLTIKNLDIGVEILKSISYYDLINGYKECFMINDKYKEGTDIVTIFGFSIFDKNFQNILFKYSVYVENSFKTKLAHTISKNFGVNEDDYLDINKYSSPRKVGRIKKQIQTIDDIKTVIANKADDPTKHYCENHNHVPPWILFKNITFNLSIDLYSFLETTEKTEIINEYFPFTVNHSDFEYASKAQNLKKMITIVRKFRNKIAHNYKVIEYKVKPSENLNPIDVIRINKNDLLKIEDNRGKSKGKGDLFAMILSIISLIDNKFLILNMLKELIFLLESNEHISIQYIYTTNLPKDIILRLDNLCKKIEKEIL